MLSLLLLGACGGSTGPVSSGGAGGTTNGGAGGAASGGAGGAANGGAGGAANGGAGGAANGGAGGAANGGAGGAANGGAGGAANGGAGGAANGGAGGASSFCTGDAPRMVVNGVTTTPTVAGQLLPLDCCRAGKFVVTTSDFAQPIAVQWRVEAGASVMPPAAVDLGSLPSGWSVVLNAGCLVTSAGCFGALDNFSAGFTGSLSVIYGDGGAGMDMNLCMHFAEPADKPGIYVHTLDLYAPHVWGSY